MSIVLPCCGNSDIYVGLDPECSKDTLICLNHSPHTTKAGIIHNIMPINHFRRTLNDLKFQMSDKVASLCDQYSMFMDTLI